MEPLNVALLWHQHQPNYKHPDQNIFILPWTRFHGLKDYYDLVTILDNYPDIHQNFNLVPSMIMQLEDYINDRCEDKVEILTKRKVKELSKSDKIDILKYFFQINFDKMVDIYPRYRALLQKRGSQFDEKNAQETLRKFTNQDYLDLQVWYNLSWTGEFHKNLSPFKELIKKDHKFTEEDKNKLLKAQKEILKKILTKHHEAEKRGQIEISSTPLFHPILPLLCDTNIAKISQPEIKLPQKRFQHPEDAEAQIEKAIEFHEKHFGKKPNGMWPSEGSVSEEVANIFAKNKIKWIATDEEVLFNSLHLMQYKNINIRENLFFPWSLKTTNGEINIFFRDHALSDLIGFVYQNWEPDKAADDFINKLKNIRKSIIQQFGQNSLKSAIVSVILDGENCWEYYLNNGKEFLENLYKLFSESKELKSTTYCEFLKNTKESNKLTKLFPGSWINHNYAIWIGHPEDNTAWDYLYDARQMLAKAEKEKKLSQEIISEAKNEIYIAEGSDWCWWYGDDHETENALEFDQMFRSHLIRVYELLNQPIPNRLYDPIRKETSKKLVSSEPMGFIHPIIDGLETNYFEWMAAGVFDTKQQGSAMHQMDNFLKLINFGFDLQDFYLKIVPHEENLNNNLDEYDIIVNTFEPCPLKMKFNLGSLYKNSKFDKVLFFNNDKWISKNNEIRIAFNKFVEIGLPFSSLNCSENSLVKFQITIMKNDQKIETWPRHGMLSFIVPGSDFEQIEWIV